MALSGEIAFIPSVQVLEVENLHAKLILPEPCTVQFTTEGWVSG